MVNRGILLGTLEDSNSGTIFQTITIENQSLTDFQVSNYQNTVSLFGGNNNGLLSFWNIKPDSLQLSEKTDLIGHTSYIKSVKFLQDFSNLVLSASADDTIRLWDVEEYRQLVKIESELVQSIEWCSELSVIIATGNSILNIYDPRIPQNLVKSAPTFLSGLRPSRVMSTRPYEFLTCGYGNGQELSFWDIRTMRIVKNECNLGGNALDVFYDVSLDLTYAYCKGFNLSILDSTFGLMSHIEDTSECELALLPTSHGKARNELSRFLRLKDDKIDILTTKVPNLCIELVDFRIFRPDFSRRSLQSWSDPPSLNELDANNQGIWTPPDSIQNLDQINRYEGDIVLRKKGWFMTEEIPAHIFVGEDSILIKSNPENLEILHYCTLDTILDIMITPKLNVVKIMIESSQIEILIDSKDFRSLQNALEYLKDKKTSMLHRKIKSKDIFGRIVEITTNRIKGTDQSLLFFEGNIRSVLGNDFSSRCATITTDGLFIVYENFRQKRILFGLSVL